MPEFSDLSRALQTIFPRGIWAYHLDQSKSAHWVNIRAARTIRQIGYLHCEELVPN